MCPDIESPHKTVAIVQWIMLLSRKVSESNGIFFIKIYKQPYTFYTNLYTNKDIMIAIDLPNFAM